MSVIKLTSNEGLGITTCLHFQKKLSLIFYSMLSKLYLYNICENFIFLYMHVQTDIINKLINMGFLVEIIQDKL